MIPDPSAETLWRQRAPSPLGEIWLARVEAGICAVLLSHDSARLAEDWQRRFPARPYRDAPPDKALHRLLAYLAGERVDLHSLPLAITGTPFQERVWAALRRIPYGQTRSYQALAHELGSAGAARAVGSACAKNPTALLIPCHRALRSDGALGGYYWGQTIKRALLSLEAGASQPTAPLPQQLPLHTAMNAHA